MSERPPKRTKLSYSKCGQCRKDRQACKPDDRKWPARCDRCVKYEYQCSPNRTRAEEAEVGIRVMENSNLSSEDIEPLTFTSTEECVQDIGHLKRLIESLKEFRFDHGVRDDNLDAFLVTLNTRWEQACRKGRAKIKCLIAKKEYAPAALLQACINRPCERSFCGKNPFLADLESSREIASAQGDISEALNIQWIIFKGLIEEHLKDGSNTQPAFERILKLTEISRHQVSQVAGRHGLDVGMCVQLNHPLYKMLCLASELLRPVFIDLVIKRQPMEALDTLVEMNPIRIAVRQADETSIKILLSGGMGAGFLKSWRPSFPMLGLAEISHSLAITQGSILHYAVAFKPEQFVLALLYFGVAINQEDDQGQTPLHVAVLNRQPSMMKLLLSRGADVNARNSRGSTPYECLLDRLELYCDAQQMDVFGVALQMVDRGANINSVNLKEHSLLYLAVKSNNSTSFVMSVLKKDASIRQGECWNSGKDSLYAAAFNGNYVLAKVLVDHDVKTYALTNTNLNAHWDTLYRTIERQLVRNPENYDSSGRKWELEWFWAASIAACRGHKEVVKLFLRYGIPVNFFDRPGHTLLFTAIEGNLKGGRENMVRMLLTMGARADVRTISGETPWTSPVTLGWEDTVDLLLIHGVDVDFTDGKGRTPLHLALGTSLWDKTIYSTTNRIAQRFLSHGCQVNIPDHEGNTALHLAARLGKWSLLKTILQACKESNAPVDPRNHRGQTPLDICKIDSTTSKFRAWVKGNGLNDISVSNDS